MQIILIALISFLLGHYAGWIHAHVTVRNECQKLGKFYVGDNVFICEQEQQ